MVYLLEGILTVGITNGSVISKIDNLIARSGFTLEEIHWKKSEGLVDFYISEPDNTDVSIKIVVDELEKLDDVQDFMWVQSKELKHRYSLIFSENITEERRTLMFTRFFDKREKMLNDAARFVLDGNS